MSWQPEIPFDGRYAVVVGWHISLRRRTIWLGVLRSTEVGRLLVPPIGMPFPDEPESEEESKPCDCNSSRCTLHSDDVDEDVLRRAGLWMSDTY